MDYTRQSVTSLFRGPLLHTPQGIVVLSYVFAYFLYAFLIGVLDVAPPFGWQVGKIVALCVSWPIILFLYFVKNNQPAFEASIAAAGWLVFYGAAPFLFILWRT